MTFKKHFEITYNDDATSLVQFAPDSGAAMPGFKSRNRHPVLFKNKDV